MTEPLISLRSSSRIKAQSNLRSVYALRISVLESCQLRCRYCQPGAITSASRRRSWLSPSEHARLAPLFAQRGVQKVRFTGGEPLLREDLSDLVATWRAALPDAELALTTNALLLEARLPELEHAGLDRLNVHLDTLRKDRVQAIMGGGDPDRCLAAVQAARALGLPTKLNVVVQRGLNDDELEEFLRVSRELDVQVRFIELMDTGSASAEVKATFFSGDDILARLAATTRFESRARRSSSDPAELFETERGITFGLIASDTRPFCEACDRLRLGASGLLRGCLYAPEGLNLGAALRAGADDAELASLLGGALADKRSWHPDVAPTRRPFSMADIGG